MTKSRYDGWGDAGGDGRPEGISRPPGAAAGTPTPQQLEPWLRAGCAWLVVASLLTLGDKLGQPRDGIVRGARQELALADPTALRAIARGDRPPSR